MLFHPRLSSRTMVARAALNFSVFAALPSVHTSHTQMSADIGLIGKLFSIFVNS
jgi:hypothetical protein